MRIIVVGGTGTIGTAVVAALRASHDVVAVGHSSGQQQVDIASRQSIERLYDDVGSFDALVSTAGSAAWKPLAELTDEDFRFSLSHKLMGQANLVRVNVVSPPWVSETLEAMGQDPSGGMPAAEVARAYVRVVEGGMTGEVMGA